MLRTPVDYENLGERDFKFSIIAADHGLPPHSATVRVSIAVTDVNDNMPEIKGYTGEGLFFSESTSVGTTIVMVAVSAPDPGPNGQVDCDIESPTFSLNLKVGERK